MVGENPLSGTGEYVAGARLIRADRTACPVCGHPTGDCVGQSLPPKRIWGLGDIPSLEHTQTVLAPEDIWEERQITPYTKSKVLVAKAGQQIPVQKARDLGLL
jgi:hypothetical protein